MHRAAQIGPMYACIVYAEDYVTRFSIEWFHWLMQPVINFSTITRSLIEVIGQVPLEYAFYVGYLVHRHPVEMFNALFTSNPSDYRAKQDAVNGYASYYLKELEATRQRVNMWLLCARRLGVVRDIRRVIGTITWNDRGKL